LAALGNANEAALLPNAIRTDAGEKVREKGRKEKTKKHGV